jgi:hypothetical protein
LGCPGKVLRNVGKREHAGPGRNYTENPMSPNG